MVRFSNRVAAGQRLAERLGAYKGSPCVVLGLPRGGVPVAAAVADALGAPLDILVSRKIGYPGNPELAIGAVTSRGTRVLNEDLLSRVLIPPGFVDTATEAARRLAESREATFRAESPEQDLAGKTAILVDDGIATGMTALAAIRDVRARKPARLVLAVPVIAPATAMHLAESCDDLVFLDAPEEFMAIGQFYDDFAQVSDEEVKALLARRKSRAVPLP